MTIITHTIWRFGHLQILDALPEMMKKSDQMVKEGKTDGTMETSWIAEGAKISRTWSSREAAEEWRDFLLQFNERPTIIEES